MDFGCYGRKGAKPFRLVFCLKSFAVRCFHSKHTAICMKVRLTRVR